MLHNIDILQYSPLQPVCPMYLYINSDTKWVNEDHGCGGRLVGINVSYYPSFLVIITHCWSDIVYSPPAHLMILTLILNTSPPSPPRRHAHYIPLFLQYCSIFPHLKFDV